MINVVDNNNPLDNVNSTTMMGVSMSPPMGNKCAKALKKQESINSNSIADLQQEIKKLVDSTVWKEKFEELVMVGKYYMKMGNIFKAEKTTAALEVLVKQNLHNRDGTSKCPAEVYVVAKTEEHILSATGSSVGTDDS
jgi:hypothetical protein